MSKISMTMGEDKWEEFEAVILRKARESSFEKDDFGFIVNFLTAVRMASQAKETFGDWDIPGTWCVAEYIKDIKDIKKN